MKNDGTFCGSTGGEREDWILDFMWMKILMYKKHEEMDGKEEVASSKS